MKPTVAFVNPLSRIAFLSAAVYAMNAVHYGWAPRSTSWIDDLLAWFTAAALLVLYASGYRALVRGKVLSGRQVVLPVLPLVLLAFITIPYDSTDVFLYMDAGWTQSHYGMNPYTDVLRSLPIDRDPIVRPEWMTSNKNPWLDLPFVYGFLFALFVRFIAFAGQGNWWLTLGLLKMVNAGVYVICARMVRAIAKSFGHIRSDAVLYLFTWSPLVLQHHIANAHNDLMVGCLIVVAAYLMATNRFVWVPSALVAAGLIKYVALPLVPAAVWLIAKREGSKTALWASIAALLIMLGCSAPFAASLPRLRFDLMFAQLNKITAGSLYAFIFYLYRTVSRFVPFIPLETFAIALKDLLWTLGGVIVIHEYYQFCRQSNPSVERWIQASSRILFVIIFVASSQFYPWYIGMLLPLVLISPKGWLRSFTINLNGTHVFSLTSLSRKGLGYFALTTGLALLGLRKRWQHRVMY